MKDMKVKTKLIFSFLVITAFCMLVGVVGIIGMKTISAAGNEMYDIQTKPLPDLAKTLEYIQRLRIQLRNAALATGNSERLAKIETDIKDRKEKFVGYAEAYGSKIVAPKGKDLYKTAMDAYNNTFVPAIDATLAGAKAGASIDELLAIIDAAADATNLVVDNFTECMNIKVTAAEAENEKSLKLFKNMMIFIIVALVLSVTTSLTFALYISGLISKPIGTIAAFLNQVGTRGDLSLDVETERQAQELSMRKDEIGLCSRAVGGMLEHFLEVEHALEKVADGDLTAELKPLSDRDNIGNSVVKMLSSLNDMFGGISASTAQVAAGSKQMAESSQMLAQGSTEQASAAEQLSSSIAIIEQKTGDNAELADKAATLAVTIKHNAEKGSHQMDEMMSAVKEINQASQSISKVMKVIDDIAFQTNILALNAAVEAARAGQHGKGFAVVAEEVRNLAAKSAEAAKDTGSLIANSMEKAELGSRIADETAASLVEIVSGINESNRLINEIAKTSGSQSEAISEINKGINQMAQVTQQNSATAEQTSSASDEMNGQAEMLKHMISQFKLKGGGMNQSFANSSRAPKSPKKNIALIEKTASSYDSGAGFGKY